MKRFVIRNKTSGKYLKTTKHSYSTSFSWDSLSNAKIYKRKCDASNSVTFNSQAQSRYSPARFSREEVEIVEVEINITFPKTPYQRAKEAFLSNIKVTGDGLDALEEALIAVGIQVEE